MDRKRLIVLLGMAGFIVMADNWVVSPILPAIAKSVRVAPAAAGVLIAAYMLPFGLFQLVFGPLADRFGKTRIVIGTLGAFSVATALLALGTTIPVLAGVRALTGLFAAATMPISLALIGDVVPVAGRQQAIGSFMGISFLGQALSMGIGGAIAFFLDWRAVFVLYGVFAAIVTVVLWRSLRQVAREETRDPHAPVLRPYIELLRNGASLRTYLVILLEGVFLLGSFSYLGTVLAARFNLSFLAIGAVMTAFGVAAVLAGRTSAGIAARLGRPRTVAAGLLTAAVANAFVVLGSGSLLATGVGVFLLGFGFMTAHSTLLTVATEFARAARGAAMSLVTFAFMLGGAVGTGLGGRVIGAVGAVPLYAAYGIGLGVLGLVALPALAAVGHASAAAEATA
jgi:predicted MFS family arabinose efflux permease